MYIYVYVKYRGAGVCVCVMISADPFKITRLVIRIAISATDKRGKVYGICRIDETPSYIDDRGRGTGRWSSMSSNRRTSLGNSVDAVQHKSSMRKDERTLSAKRIIVSSLAIFFVDHVADYVALNSESESRRVRSGLT